MLPPSPELNKTQLQHFFGSKVIPYVHRNWLGRLLFQIVTASFQRASLNEEFTASPKQTHKTGNHSSSSFSAASQLSRSTAQMAAPGSHLPFHPCGRQTRHSRSHSSEPPRSVCWQPFNKSAKGFDGIWQQVAFQSEEQHPPAHERCDTRVLQRRIIREILCSRCCNLFCRQHGWLRVCGTEKPTYLRYFVSFGRIGQVWSNIWADWSSGTLMLLITSFHQRRFVIYCGCKSFNMTLASCFGSSFTAESTFVIQRQYKLCVRLHAIEHGPFPRYQQLNFNHNVIIIDRNNG